MPNWQSLNTNKKVVTKTVPLEEKQQLRDEIYAMQDRGLCVVNSERTTTKTYTIQWVYDRKSMSEDAIRNLMNTSVKPIKFNRKGKASKNGVEKRFNTDSNNVMAVVNISDFHFNRQVTGDEGYGVDYDIDKAEKVFLDIIDEAKKRIRRNGHNISRIILNTCGDFLNSDTRNHTTTAGTPQNDSTSLRTAVKRACDLLEHALLELSQIAPVEYYFIPGNHDESMSLAMALYLDGRFKDFDTVTIDTSFNSRATVLHGSNVLVFSHGNNERNRAIDLPLVEPAAKERLSSATNVEVLTGHAHTVNVTTNNGVRWEVLASACPVQCNWSYDSGYNSNPEVTINYYDEKYRVQQDTIYTKVFMQ